MRIAFVAHPDWQHAGSTILRSRQMAEFCKAHIPEHEFVYQTNLDVKDSVVILHKFWLSRITKQELKTLRDGNFVVADPIDGHCPVETDAKLSVHSQQDGHYVAHLVDTRIPRNWQVTDQFAVGYYGTLSNTEAPPDVRCISCYEKGIEVLSEFSAHYTVRRTVKEGFKPPLKLWTAAVCGVPVLTSMDNDVPLYLKDYPYKASNALEAIPVLAQMKRDFKSEKWEDACSKVRSTYSDDRVVSDMRTFLNGIA